MTINLAKAYLDDDVTLYVKGAAGVDGEPTYSDGSAVVCRVAPLSEFTRSMLANTSKATAKVFFDPATTVSEGDRLTVGSTN